MKQGSFVLENKIGQVVRTLHLESSDVAVIRRSDSGRIEVVSSLKELDQDNIEYTLITETTRDKVMKEPVAVGDYGTLRYLPKIEKVSPSVPLRDDPNHMKSIMKWSAIAHAAILAFVLITHETIEYFTEDDHVVTVVPQRPLEKTKPKPKPTQTVQVAKSKPKPTKKKVQPRKPKTKVIAKKSYKKQRGANRKATKRVAVNKSGALGVLGGHSKNARGAGGLNLNAAKNSRGSGLKGSAGAGGFERSLHGKGLIAAPVGSGETARGAGGYGTRGKGGGSAGYGRMNMAGSASAYSQPLGDEALVEGGLDYDQVAAVINRHIGQITYCYEQGLQTKPSLKGRVAVRFVISPSGRVSSARVANSSLSSGKVEGCILSKLRRWKFPRPVGNVSVGVTYPFMFNRVSQG